jgi:hypothetical protein
MKKPLALIISMLIGMSSLFLPAIAQASLPPSTQALAFDANGGIIHNANADLYSRDGKYTVFESDADNVIPNRTGTGNQL